jgi:hypothetical protein
MSFTTKGVIADAGIATAQSGDRERERRAAGANGRRQDVAKALERR